MEYYSVIKKRVKECHLQQHGGTWWLSGKEPTCQCRRHEIQVWSLGREDPLEEEMATHFSILAWTEDTTHGVANSQKRLKWLSTWPEHVCPSPKFMGWKLTPHMMVLGVAQGICDLPCSPQTLICVMQDLVPWLGIELGPLALRVWSLSHWATREALCHFTSDGMN